MPTLDQQGHIPQDVLFSHEGWRRAAEECGVDRVEVEHRDTAINRLHDLADDLAAAADEYAVAVGCELEMMPWGRRERIIEAAQETADVFGRFVVAAEVARGLLDSPNWLGEGAAR